MTEKIVVQVEAVEEFMKECKEEKSLTLKHMRVSSVTGEGVEELFNMLVKALIQNNNQENLLKNPKITGRDTKTLSEKVKKNDKCDC